MLKTLNTMKEVTNKLINEVLTKVSCYTRSLVVATLSLSLG